MKKKFLEVLFKWICVSQDDFFKDWCINYVNPAVISTFLKLKKIFFCIKICKDWLPDYYQMDKERLQEKSYEISKPLWKIKRRKGRVR